MGRPCCGISSLTSAYVRAVSGKVSQKNLIIGVVGAVVAVAGIALLWKKCTSASRSVLPCSLLVLLECA